MPPLSTRKSKYSAPLRIVYITYKRSIATFFYDLKSRLYGVFQISTEIEIRCVHQEHILSGQRSSRPLPNSRSVKVGPGLLKKLTSLNNDNERILKQKKRKKTKSSEMTLSKVCKIGVLSLATHFSLLLKRLFRLLEQWLLMEQ